MTATDAASRRPRTASRPVRRRQLIEATIECIAEEGLSGTTMAQVTKRAELSMGLVSFHFRSKENLLHETLVHLAEEHRGHWVQSLADSALDPAAKLAAVMDAHFHPATCNPTRIAVWFAFFGEARYRDVYREEVSRFDNERNAIVAELCEVLAERERAPVSGAEVARHLETLADGLWLSIMLYPDWLTREDARRQLHSYLTAIFPRHFTDWPGAPSQGGAPAPDTPRSSAEGTT